MSGCTGGAASTASKNALPRLFVAHGPVNRSYSSTGRSGTASSSSCSVGWRCSAHWFGMPAAHRRDPLARRARPCGARPAPPESRGSTSCSRESCDSRDGWPGSRCGCAASTRPGHHRAPAQIDDAGARRRAAGARRRLLAIGRSGSTRSVAMVFRASIVWIRPLTRIRSWSASGANAVCACASDGSPVQIPPAAAPATVPAVVPMNCRRENIFLVIDILKPAGAARSWC